ncbi:hypothetical protein MICCA_2750012 [Microcystis aeruginosa PCC 9432]|uniref:Uncharacterized protein n=3 Tax=Microcystis aeruginosa TaxID=1126 RepID=A0A822LCX1_MICAE|nr:hypothetical protein BH695_3365 [Microcystis aeruginosa PCC 7806SL]NCR98768.1 hypothetical protein [Microcystis aeruginosa L311-01]TRT96522.1 MAG: hypothetical protein EWV61_20610 [Microcystis aeruginosa Ma_AC_P_19900807_S300]TRU08975.1 MAG: hypothetical protein EWV59_14840 [Microcystis aeruginosa Ma_MB_F_20061100_S19D]TRU12897.1 MAG: hypothetical protein EWV58_15675 [Microcystis aeruginosa Ma_MB_F_20061100_S19]CCH93082.1 hypothetical protein MICCA_2750012 [Microcystis aeruginosa PCC 9432]
MHLFGEKSHKTLTLPTFHIYSANPKYYENFSDFSSAIYECLNDAHLKHKKELNSLLTLPFQKLNKSQIMNV